MPEPTNAVEVRPIPGTDAEVVTTNYLVPGLGLLPINAFLIRAQEPILVDTGPIVMRDAYLEALEGAIELRELRWLYLTHADPDHVGCLGAILAAAPRLTVITTFLGLGKLGLYQQVPPDRVYLLNPGQRLSVGDRELVALKPPTFDAPETTAFVDSKTGVLFSSDSFGAVLERPFVRAADIPPAALREGMVTWATVDAPWLSNVEATTFEATLARLRDLKPSMVLSSHLPPASGLLDTMLGHLSTASHSAPFVGPDQRALLAMLAAMGPPPSSAPRVERH